MRIPRRFPTWAPAMSLTWKYNSRDERSYTNRGPFWVWIDDEDWGIYTDDARGYRLLYHSRNRDFQKAKAEVERRLFALSPDGPTQA